MVNVIPHQPNVRHQPGALYRIVRRESPNGIETNYAFPPLTRAQAAAKIAELADTQKKIMQNLHGYAITVSVSWEATGAPSALVESTRGPEWAIFHAMLIPKGEVT